jgi:hypothetical protein
MTDMTEIHKEYAWPFSLEPTKLTRLIDIVHERLADHSSSQALDSFSVFQKGDRLDKLSDVSQVLALENLKKRKIQRVLIQCSGASGESGSQREVTVDFTGPRTIEGQPSRTAKGIRVSVQSEDAAWVTRTFSEVEEQVERTRQNYTQPILILVAVLFCLITVLSLKLPLIPLGNQSTAIDWPMWLREKNMERVKTIIGNDKHIISDDERREVETMQLSNVIAYDALRASPPARELKRIWVLIAPSAFVIICAGLLALFCYPKAVFLWGDEIARNLTMQRFRTTLWSLIIAIIVGGGVANLFFQGIMN